MTDRRLQTTDPKYVRHSEDEVRRISGKMLRFAQHDGRLFFDREFVWEI